MKLDTELFSKAPDPMSKDVFRCVCHISKKTALYLLESGKVRSVNTGKITHKWLISKDEVLRYANECSHNENDFKPPENYYSARGIFASSAYLTVVYMDMDKRTLVAAENYYLDEMGREPGILTVEDVARITGYAKESVYRWIWRKKLRKLAGTGRTTAIPKQFLLRWLLSEGYNNIQNKSAKHKRDIVNIHMSVMPGGIYCGNMEE